MIYLAIVNQEGLENELKNPMWKSACGSSLLKYKGVLELIKDDHVVLEVDPEKTKVFARKTDGSLWSRCFDPQVAMEHLQKEERIVVMETWCKEHLGKTRSVAVVAVAGKTDAAVLV